MHIKATPARVGGGILLIVCMILIIFAFLHIARYREGICVDEKNVVSIDKGSITGDGFEYMLTNFDLDVRSFGAEYHIEQKQAHGWVELPYIRSGIAWTLVGCSLLPHESTLYTADWSSIYGTLRRR